MHALTAVPCAHPHGQLLQVGRLLCNPTSRTRAVERWQPIAHLGLYTLEETTSWDSRQPSDARESIQC